MLRKLVIVLMINILMPICLVRFQGIWGFRRYLKSRGIQSGILIHVYDHYFAKTGAYVGFGAHFAGDPCVPHGWNGIYITNGAVIGKNITIFQQVTIGSNTLSETGRAGFPVIGDNVYIGAVAKVIGRVYVGNNCRIGANAVVYKDIPDNSVAVQSATRLILKGNLDNGYFTFRNGKEVYFDDGEYIPL